MTRKIASLAAASAMVLASIASTAAWAVPTQEPLPQGPDAGTLADMQSQCDAIAASYDTGNGDVWTGEVVLGGATLVSGPTETGPRTIDESSIELIGPYVPATSEIRGDPFRIGGSVNLFGDQWSTAGYWPDHSYNYTADFESTFRYDFSCNINFEKYYPAEVIHHRAVGVYVFNDDGTGGDEEAIRRNCEQQTDNGQPWWGQLYIPNDNNPRCRFEGTPAYDEIIDEHYDPPILHATVAGTPVDQAQTDNLPGFEAHGGRIDVTGEFHIGQVVVCISPSTGGGNGKKGNPGEWRQQNGYTGDKCTTDWFKVAPWGAGTESSNGTYISVPNYSL